MSQVMEPILTHNKGENKPRHDEMLRQQEAKHHDEEHQKKSQETYGAGQEKDQGAGQAQGEGMDSLLLDKLRSYSLWSTAVDYYQNLKQNVPIAKSGLDMAESVAKKGIDATIPVLKKVDAYTKVDERSAALLTALENGASSVKNGAGVVNQVALQPLDSILDALDKYLPSEQGISFDEDQKKEGEEVDPHHLTSVGKIRFIGERLSTVSVTKLRELQLRGPNHVEAVHNITDLVQYATGILRLDSLTDDLKERYYAASHKLVEGRKVAMDKLTDTQHDLFNKAATAATNAHEFAARSPSFVALEKAITPYLQNLTTLTEKQIVLAIAAFGSAVDITNNFFNNTKTNITETAEAAVKRASEWFQQYKKDHPEWQSRIASFIEGLNNLASKASDVASQIAYAQFHNIQSLYKQLFDVLEKVELYIRKVAQGALNNSGLVTYTQVKEIEQKLVHDKEERDHMLHDREEQKQHDREEKEQQALEASVIKETHPQPTIQELKDLPPQPIHEPKASKKGSNKSKGHR